MESLLFFLSLSKDAMGPNTVYAETMNGTEHVDEVPAPTEFTFRAGKQRMNSRTYK